jgi:hypothetical protein
LAEKTVQNWAVKRVSHLAGRMAFRKEHSLAAMRGNRWAVNWVALKARKMAAVRARRWAYSMADSKECYWAGSKVVNLDERMVAKWEHSTVVDWAVRWDLRKAVQTVGSWGTNWLGRLWAGGSHLETMVCSMAAR